MDHLDQLESGSIYILRETVHKFKNAGLLWSIGKDSTTMLWLARKAFFGALPFPVLHIDTSYKFPAIYAFRDRFAKEWDLDLRVIRNEAALQNGVSPAASKLDCCHQLKTEALKMAIEQQQYKALFLAIRRDEHGIRAKERYCSPRDTDFQWNYQDQPLEMWDQFASSSSDGKHMRIHPMLHWTELDIWRYVEREKIPMVDLYLARNNARYRSIGCACCCAPVPSRADTLPKIIRELSTTTEAERSGRAQDKENTYTMQKLRSLGYM